MSITLKQSDEIMGFIEDHYHYRGWIMEHTTIKHDDSTKTIIIEISDVPNVYWDGLKP